MKLRKHLSKVIFLLVLITMTMIISYPEKAEASSATYRVYNLKTNSGRIDFGSTLLKTSNFSSAMKEMEKYKNGVVTSDKSPSPLKIVAATRGQAQSYPYRKGKHAAGVTLNIYTNTGLTSAYTYIPAHYMMYVYGYIEVGGRILADVEIQGGKGYVEVDKTDIIPMIYIENGIEIEIGGNENYYSTKEKPYKIIPTQERYTVGKGDKYNELVINAPRSSNKLSGFSYAYAVAPDFLKPGTTYYSPDGIRFYTDRDLKKRIGGDFYAYYQWLPLRSMTEYNSKTFDSYLKSLGKNDSVMLGQNHHFVEESKKYGMNATLIFHQANLESGYGTSKYAKERNNLFGWKAVDSNPDQAATYDNIGEGIGYHMDKQIGGYMRVSDWRHFGPAFGNKRAGFTVKYASDPYYGIKVANLYYRIDKLNNYKDYNSNNLSLLENGKSYEVKNYSNDKTWYETKKGLEEQVIVNLGKEKDKLKTIPFLPKDNGLLDTSKDFAYIEDKDSTIIDLDKNGVVSGLKYKEGIDALTKADLRLRRQNNTSSDSLVTIPKGTKLVVNPTNTGWGRTNYGGKVGFVSLDYLEKVTYIEPGKPSYTLGDVNNDGNIDGFDMMEIKRHYLNIKKLSGDKFKAADINKDGIVDGFDMMDVKRHYLGIKQIKE